MEVRHREQLSLTLREPFLRGGCLAFWAVPIATLLYEIWVCEQFSQRRTCPPSAAVRQFSIADIAFN